MNLGNPALATGRVFHLGQYVHPILARVHNAQDAKLVFFDVAKDQMPPAAQNANWRRKFRVLCRDQRCFTEHVELTLQITKIRVCLVYGPRFCSVLPNTAKIALCGSRDRKLEIRHSGAHACLLGSRPCRSSRQSHC